MDRKENTQFVRDGTQNVIVSTQFVIIKTQNVMINTQFVIDICLEGSKIKPRGCEQIYLTNLN